MSQMTHHIWRLYCTLDMSCRHNGRLGTTVALGRECLGTQWCHLNDRSLNQEQAKPTSNNQRRNSPSSWMNCVNHINVWWKSLGKIEKKTSAEGVLHYAASGLGLPEEKKESAHWREGLDLAASSHVWGHCMASLLPFLSLFTRYL